MPLMEGKVKQIQEDILQDLKSKILHSQNTVVTVLTPKDEQIYENSYIKNQPKNIVIQEKNNSSLKKLKDFNLKHLKTEKTPIKSKLDEYEIMNRKTF